MASKAPFQPLVSVLLLTWNHAEFIRTCFESILNDPYKNVEIICCENGSSDTTWAELQKIRADYPDRQITLFQNPPKTSITKGFNDMLARATGELVCLFSGDDLFHHDRVARQVELFRQHPALQITYANGTFLGGDQDGQPVHNDALCAQIFHQPALAVLQYIFANRGLMVQTFMARRSLLVTVGGFDEQALSDDWILNIRLFSHLTQPAQYSFTPFSAFLYRQHGSNMYKNFPRQSASMVEVIDKYYHFPDRARQLADMYFYQAKVGIVSYRYRHLRLALAYAVHSLHWSFSLKRLMLIPVYLIAVLPGVRPLARWLQGRLRPVK